MHDGGVGGRHGGREEGVANQLRRKEEIKSRAPRVGAGGRETVKGTKKGGDVYTCIYIGVRRYMSYVHVCVCV